MGRTLYTFILFPVGRNSEGDFPPVVRLDVASASMRMAASIAILQLQLLTPTYIASARRKP